MPRFVLILSYDGTGYNGWQIQENTPRTIQQVIQDKMSILFKAPVELTGCGRTDTGVHADFFVAHFDLGSSDILHEISDPVYKLNALLPEDIVIHDCLEVPETFHARYDAIEREYHYYLHQRRNPFIRLYSYFQYGRLDFEKMNKACEYLLGERDYSCFSKMHSDQENNICEIRFARWFYLGAGRWKFVIRANRFLRGMVRAIVGTLLWVGKDRITLREFEDIIRSGDRKKAGPNVPAHGLVLAAVRYPNSFGSHA